MYAISDVELARLERESARVQQATGATSQADDLLFIPWLAGSPDTPSVPCGVAKAIRPGRVAELADAVEQLSEEDLLRLSEHCFLSELQARQCFHDLRDYLKERRADKKTLLFLVK